MMETLEFSGGGQVQVVELPYVSPLKQLPTTPDWLQACLQHGIYYIHLQQPLVVNGQVPTAVFFNVYVSAGDDFQLFGYSVDPANVLVYDAAPPSFTAEAAVPENLSNSAGLEIHREQEDNKLLDDDFRPVVSIRDYLRRLAPVYDKVFNQTDLQSTSYVVTLDVARLMGVNQPYIQGDGFIASTLNHLNRMFLGYNGGVKTKILITGGLDATIYYIPPGFTFDLATTPPSFVATMPNPSNGPVAAAFTVQATSRASALTDLNRWKLQTVGKESTAHTMNVPNALSQRRDYRASDCLLATRSEVEFEIPNMSPFRFLGDPTSFYKYNSTPDYSDSAVNAMGHIMIAFPDVGMDPGFQLQDENLLHRSIQLTIWMGITDEARFGYGVYSPSFQFPSFGVTTPAGSFMCADTQYGYHNETPVQFLSSCQSNPGLTAPAAWFTRS